MHPSSILGTNWILRILFFALMSILLSSCVPKVPELRPAEIIKNLTDTVYHLPARKSRHSSITYLPLRRFDIIFVGYDLRRLRAKKKNELLNMIYMIPGHFTHAMVYLGKDAHGNAYAMEVNGDDNVNLSLTMEGLHADAKLRVLCLGKDYSVAGCRRKTKKQGLKSYDYMWAKRLRPALRKRLFRHEKRLIQTIRDDLRSSFSFQIPLDVRVGTLQKKIIPLVNDGKKNGADCVDYFISLFEEEARVCMRDIYMGANELMRFFIQDSKGKRAVIPKEYNFLTHEKISIHDFLLKDGYRLQESRSRRTQCDDRRVVHGVATPNRLFHSPDLVDVRK